MHNFKKLLLLFLLSFAGSSLLVTNISAASMMAMTEDAIRFANELSGREGGLSAAGSHIADVTR